MAEFPLEEKYASAHILSLDSLHCARSGTAFSMRSLRPFLLLASSLVALVSGCTTAPAPLADDEYQSPAATAATAVVKGSRVTEGGVFGDVHTGYVYMIDLKSVRDAAENWDKDIVLTPGKHTIMVEYRYSDFKRTDHADPERQSRHLLSAHDQAWPGKYGRGKEILRILDCGRSGPTGDQGATRPGHGRKERHHL